MVPRFFSRQKSSKLAVEDALGETGQLRYIAILKNRDWDDLKFSNRDENNPRKNANDIHEDDVNKEVTVDFTQARSIFSQSDGNFENVESGTDEHSHVTPSPKDVEHEIRSAYQIVSQYCFKEYLAELKQAQQELENLNNHDRSTENQPFLMSIENSSLVHNTGETSDIIRTESETDMIAPPTEAFSNIYSDVPVVSENSSPFMKSEVESSEIHCECCTCCDRYRNSAEQKLMIYKDKDAFCTIFDSFNDEHYYIKVYDGYSYVVATCPKYHPYLAVEVVDVLSNCILVQKNKDEEALSQTKEAPWNKWFRNNKPNATKEGAPSNESETNVTSDISSKTASLSTSMLLDMNRSLSKTEQTLEKTAPSSSCSDDDPDAIKGVRELSRYSSSGDLYSECDNEVSDSLEARANLGRQDNFSELRKIDTSSSAVNPSEELSECMINDKSNIGLFKDQITNAGLRGAEHKSNAASVCTSKLLDTRDQKVLDGEEMTMPSTSFSDNIIAPSKTCIDLSHTSNERGQSVEPTWMKNLNTQTRHLFSRFQKNGPTDKIEEDPFQTHDVTKYTQVVFSQYGFFDEGTRGYQCLVNSIELKHQMNEAIQSLLLATPLEQKELTNKLFGWSRTFKNRTGSVRNKKAELITNLGAGFALGSIVVFAVGGLIIAGPELALLSALGAEAVETSVLAAACGIAYRITTHAAQKTWFWSQPFVYEVANELVAG